MSLSLVLASQQYAWRSGLAVNFPFTIAVWFKAPDADNALHLAELKSTSGYDFHLVAAQGPIDDKIYAMSYGGSWTQAITTGTYSASTWHNAVGVFNNGADRRAFLDGGYKGTEGSSQSFLVNNEFYVGSHRPSSGPSFMTGKIAHVAIWSIALSDAEVALIGAGYNPLVVQAASLVGYWPLVSDAVAAAGGVNLTLVNTPTFDGADNPVISTIYDRVITVSGKSQIIVPTPDYSTSQHTGRTLDWPQEIRGPGFTVDVDSAHAWGPLVPREVSALGDKGTWGKTPDAERSQPENRKFTGDNIYQSVERVWFEHTHLLPRLTQVVGNVITERTIPCDLYNADRNDAVICTSISNNLGDGFEVLGVPATPFTLDPQDGFAFTIKVLQSGALRFDGTYTFNFDSGESQTIRIVGSRIILLPYRPEAPLKEHLVFDTRILEAIDSTEQRRANREFPRGVFEMNFQGNQRRIECILFDRLSKVLAIPAWHEPSFLSSPVTAGDKVINLNTTSYANFYVGGNAIILKDEFTYDVAKIEAMTATTITLDTATANSYDANTQVMPLMAAYVEATAPMAKALVNDQSIKLKAYVNACDNDIADASEWSTYNSKVFLDDPNFIDGAELDEALRTKVFVLDNLTGDRSQFSQWAHSLRHSAKGWKTRDRASLWKLRKLLHFLKGKQVSFYIPTFSNDLWPTQTLVNASSSFTMAMIGYTVNVHQRWPKQVFRLILKNGTILTRTIVNSVEATSDTEQLTVNTPWPYDIQPADIERIEFLQKVRLDTDDIVITHFNALGHATCVVPTKEVTD